MMPTNKEPTYNDQVRQLAESGQFTELIDTLGITNLPAYGNPLPEATPIRKSDAPDTAEIVDLLKNGKSNNRKFGGQFAGQTPDTTQKNTTEERDVDSWGVERQRKKENREWGLPEEHDMSDPAPADPNVAKPSRSNNLVDPMKIAAEEEPYKPEVNYRGIIQDKIKPKAKPQKQMSYAELVAHRKENPEAYPEIALEHLEKEGTGGHGVGDGAGAQVANGGAGLASGGTAHVSTSAGIFTATHGGHRGRKIKRTSDGSHTVGQENFTDRGNYVPALTEYVKKQFLDKAKAPYYNRDVQGLNTSTIRDQKSQKKQSKQDNMAGHKRNSIWRNP
jgi:hypothetical protein